MNDRLYRSRDERMLAGVAGGIAERFDLDPSLVRIGWVILAIITGSAFFWIYIVMAIVVPEEPSTSDPWAGWTAATAPGAVAGWTTPGSTGAGAAPGGAAGAATGAAFAAAGPPNASGAEPAGEPPAPDGSTLTDVAMPGAPAPAAATTAAGAAAVSGAPAFVPPAGGTPPPQAASSTAPPPGWGAEPTGRRRHRRRGSGGVVGGIILILLGGYFLLATLAPDIDLGSFWPVIFVVIGAALVVGSLVTGRDGDGTG